MSKGDKETSVLTSGIEDFSRKGRIDRKGWKRVRLGEVCEITTGKKDVNSESPNGAFPFFTCSRKVHRSNSYSFDCEAILIAGNGDVGTLHYFNGKFEAYQRTYVLSNFKIDVHYCLEYLSSKLIPTLSANSLGSTIPYILLDQLKTFQIQIPLNALEQQRIANSIEKFDTYITTIESLISKYEAIKKSTVNLLLEPKNDWKEILLGDIGDVLMCKRILKNQTTMTGDVPFYKIGTFGKIPDSFISRALFDDFKQRFAYPQKGDVLLSAAGTIGRTVVFNGEDAYFQDSNIVWIDNDESLVINSFLYVLYSQMDWQTENGGTVSRLYNSNIRNTRITIPSLKEQKRIVAILDSIDGTIGNLKSQLVKTQNIKEGMMTYFFG